MADGALSVGVSRGGSYAAQTSMIPCRGHGWPSFPWSLHGHRSFYCFKVRRGQGPRSELPFLSASGLACQWGPPAKVGCEAVRLCCPLLAGDKAWILPPHLAPSQVLPLTPAPDESEKNGIERMQGASSCFPSVFPTCHRGRPGEARCRHREHQGCCSFPGECLLAAQPAAGIAPMHSEPLLRTASMPDSPGGKVRICLPSPLGET